MIFSIFHWSRYIKYLSFNSLFLRGYETWSPFAIIGATLQIILSLLANAGRIIFQYIKSSGKFPSQHNHMNQTHMQHTATNFQCLRHTQFPQ